MLTVTVTFAPSHGCAALLPTRAARLGGEGEGDLRPRCNLRRHRTRGCGQHAVDGGLGDHASARPRHLWHWGLKLASFKGTPRLRARAHTIHRPTREQAHVPGPASPAQRCNHQPHSSANDGGWASGRERVVLNGESEEAGRAERGQVRPYNTAAEIAPLERPAAGRGRRLRRRRRDGGNARGGEGGTPPCGDSTVAGAA